MHVLICPHQSCTCLAMPKSGCSCSQLVTGRSCQLRASVMTADASCFWLKNPVDSEPCSRLMISLDISCWHPLFHWCCPQGTTFKATTLQSALLTPLSTVPVRYNRPGSFWAYGLPVPLALAVHSVSQSQSFAHLPARAPSGTNHIAFGLCCCCW